MALQWMSLVATIWLQSVSGTNTNFPAYSSRLKQHLSISQVQLNNLAFANDAGKLFGWFSGVAALHLPLWLVLLIGSCLGFVGYGLQYLFLVNRVVTSLSYWQVFFLTALAGNSICWINTVCYIVAIRNFPSDRRQIAVGISTSYAGLSAKIFTDTVEIMNGVSSPPKAYLLLNSLLPLLVSLLASPMLRETKTRTSPRLPGGFIILFAITILTEGSNVVKAVADAGVMEEVEPRAMVKRVDFWLYFFVYFFGATLGLVYLNNLGQIAESRGFTNTSLLVSLSSSLGFFGRLLPSLYDSFFSMKKYKVSRGATIAAIMMPMCGAFFLLLHSSHVCLYISTSIIGICTGSITSIAVSTTSELFGAKNFGVNHNILVTNIAIGSFIFGDFAAYLYNRQGGGSGTCMGMKCFHDTFVVWGFLCFLGIVLAFYFHAKTLKIHA